MPANILKEIVREKRKEVAALYKEHDLQVLKSQVRKSPKSFYARIAEKAQKSLPFIISEFKRKSPSEGWINQHTPVEEQANLYIEKGASAMSVLTDHAYFGGNYDDLTAASKTLDASPVLLLQKDFVIDPIQVYLARANGANLILLIAAILEVQQMKDLKELAESLGMGVLAEVHSLDEYEKIKALNFTVLGVNNRDLSNFKTALNCCNYIAHNIDHRNYLIAESGMGTALDFRIASQHAHGFLVGTSLMRDHKSVPLAKLTEQVYFFKACGIREQQDLIEASIQQSADLIGINLSPISKRKVETDWLEGKALPKNAVAVFKDNSEEEIKAILAKYPFQYVQLYSSDVSLAFVKELKQKIILAVSVKAAGDWQKVLEYAAYVDLFILDGAIPGSGELIEQQHIPQDFPYPFLLAGGMNAGNLQRIQTYKNCIGVDMASGIETDGKVDMKKIALVSEELKRQAETIHHTL